MVDRALDVTSVNDHDNRISGVPSTYDEKPELLSEPSLESINQPRGLNSKSSNEKDTDVMANGNAHERGVIGKDGVGGVERGMENGEELTKTKSVKSVRDVGSIPNGGLTAWLQVVGAFVLFFNTWGIINTFGSYQAYYTSGFLSSSNPSAIAWIGSIQAFLLLIVGMVSGPIYDAGYFHSLLIGGSFMLVLGQMMLSLCHEYWQVLLAQAICIGVGTGALFIPSVAILNTYFTTRIGLAVGISASGSSLGTYIHLS
jgi:hypothetical protein